MVHPVVVRRLCLELVWVGLLVASCAVARGQPMSVCKPPNVARAALSGYYAKSEPISCPGEGLCYHSGGRFVDRAWWIDVICLTPEENAEAEARGAGQ